MMKCLSLNSCCWAVSLSFWGDSLLPDISSDSACFGSGITLGNSVTSQTSSADVVDWVVLDSNTKVACKQICTKSPNKIPDEYASCAVFLHTHIYRYGLFDDDCFCNGHGLVTALSAFDSNQPWCFSQSGRSYLRSRPRTHLCVCVCIVKLSKLHWYLPPWLDSLRMPCPALL